MEPELEALFPNHSVNDFVGLAVTGVVGEAVVGWLVGEGVVGALVAGGSHKKSR